MEDREQIISISTGSYIGYPLETALEEIAKTGATHTELIWIHGYSRPFEEDYFNEKNARHVHSLLMNNSLINNSFSSHLDLTRKENILVFKKRMDFAKAVGSEIIITYTGPWEREKQFFENMQEVIKHAEALDMMIALENPGDGKRSIIGAGRSAAGLIRKIGSERVRVNYDIGNLMSEFRGDILAEEDIPSVLEYIANFHIKDSTFIPGGWTYPEIGKGDVDFDTVFDLINNHDRNIPMCIEIPLSLSLRQISGQIVNRDTPLPLDYINDVNKRSLDFVRRKINEKVKQY